MYFSLILNNDLGLIFVTSFFTGQSLGMETIEAQTTQIRTPTLSSFGSQFHLNQ